MTPTERAYADYAHAERMELRREIAKLERVCEHHVQMRASQERMLADQQEEIQSLRLALRHKVVAANWKELAS